jgi:hypothetical protein
VAVDVHLYAQEPPWAVPRRERKRPGKGRVPRVEVLDSLDHQRAEDLHCWLESGEASSYGVPELTQWRGHMPGGRTYSNGTVQPLIEDLERVLAEGRLAVAPRAALTAVLGLATRCRDESAWLDLSTD